MFNNGNTKNAALCTAVVAWS